MNIYWLNFFEVVTWHNRKRTKKNDYLIPKNQIVEGWNRNIKIIKDN
jgi:hypothetical protein